MLGQVNKPKSYEELLADAEMRMAGLQLKRFMAVVTVLVAVLGTLILALTFLIVFTP